MIPPPGKPLPDEVASRQLEQISHTSALYYNSRLRKQYRRSNPPGHVQLPLSFMRKEISERGSQSPGPHSQLEAITRFNGDPYTHHCTSNDEIVDMSFNTSGLRVPVISWQNDQIEYSTSFPLTIFTDPSYYNFMNMAYNEYAETSNGNIGYFQDQMHQPVYRLPADDISNVNEAEHSVPKNGLI